MSKIINKGQLDFLIESTIKEYNPKEYEERESHIGSMYQGNNPEVMKQMALHNPEYASDYDLHFRKTKDKGTQTPPQEDIDSAMNYVSYMKDGVCECGGMVYEGMCNECGSSYMGEELHGGQKELDKNNNGKIDSEDFAIMRGDKEEKDDVEESVKDLAESVTKTFNPSFLTEEMNKFNKLINYRNK